MAGVLVSPRFDNQIRKRSSLYKKRNESPKFRDILRARCHARIKASRCALIDKFRNLKDNDELHNTLTGILRDEANQLIAKEFTPRQYLDEEIEESHESEEDQWLIQEYEKILAEEEANFSSDWESQVICPLCEMCILSHNGRIPFCFKCNLSFPPVESLATLKSHLDYALMSHSENCDSLASFAVSDSQEMTGLFLICESCWFFSHVV